MVHLMDMRRGRRRALMRCAAADAMRVGRFGQPSADPLQHPRMAQVLAFEVHKLAVGWVSHHRWFEPLGPTIFRNAWQNLCNQSAKVLGEKTV